MTPKPQRSRNARGTKRPRRAATRATLACAAAGSFLAAALLLSLANAMPPSRSNLEPAGMGLPSGHAQIGCVQCHAANPEAPKPVSASLLDNEERLCANCHSGAIEASHPSGFAPARPLPAAFPLDAEGKMTCSTCHDFHGDNLGLLRGADRGEELCLSCHRAEFFSAMADRGASLTMSSHFDASPRQWTNLDPYSVRCMACHEDRLSSSRQLATAAIGDFSDPGSSEHPIGRVYDDAAQRGDYRPRTHLAEEMLLPKGRVGCVSCHVPYSRNHARPPRTDGALCQECHQL